MAIKEFIVSNPKASIIGISFLVTLVMTLVTKYFTNQNRMKELKDMQKACQIKLKDHKGNPEKMSEINKEMMECSMEMMKHSFKPMFITFLPLILMFWWLRGAMTATVLAGNWIWYYIIAGILSSIILRKVLKVI
ncbi:MAG: DUF106 domain-containing protein [Nanoarchaeota archaeon]|nr:DUF106 domain-containing protein [Nanoarchaeota archaeon]